MARSSDPRKGAWKNQGANQPAHSPGKPGEWKSQQTKADSVLPFWRRKAFKIALAVAGLGIVTALVLVVMRWWNPEPPPRLILITAGYEDKLAVPHNVAGRKSAKAMRDWVDEYNRTANTPKEKIEVTEVDGIGIRPIEDAFPVSSWVQQGPSKVIIHVSAHGVVALGPGQTPICCLVPSDYPARGEGEDRELYGLYKLDDLLKLLRDRLPSSTLKLLVLDVTSVAAHWPMGQFQSDFARTLQSAPYKTQIAAVPNLVVMLSSDHNQRSWAAPDAGKGAGTSFSHFLAEGLGGAARPAQGQLLDAKTLHEHVDEKVKHWARNNRARVQSPLLIDPHNQAKNVQVRVSREKYVPPEVAARADDDAIEKELQALQAEWEKSYELANTSPPPWAFAPERWRVYVDTLLRIEELIRAGDPTSAAALRGKVRSLAEALELARREERPSHRLSTAMPEALGLSLTAAAEKLLDEFARHLARGDYEACDKTLANLRTSLERDQQSLVRIRASRLVVQHLAKEKNASANRDLYARLQARLDSPESPPRPAEAHFLLMLQLAKDQVSPAQELLAAGRWDLIEKALRLRVQAEDAACGLGGPLEGNLPAASEQVYPWIQGDVEAADSSRRSGQDLLFASQDADAWNRVSKAPGGKGLLEESADRYARAQQDAAKVRRGLAARDRALAHLPYYTRWLAEQPLVPEEENPLRSAWADLHRLSELLRDLPPADAKLRDSFLSEIDSKAKTVAKFLDSKKREHKEKMELEYSSRDRQDSWHEIERLLRVPALPDPDSRLVVSAKQRVELIRTQLKLARQLQIDAEKNPGKGGAEHTLRDARDEARRQARLAQAVLGNADGRHDPGRDDLRDLNRDVSDAELVVIGQRVADRLIAMGAKCQQLTDKALAPATMLPDVRKNLNEGSALARHLDGWAVTDRLGEGPVSLARKFALHLFLQEQGRRTFRDHWASLAGKPYYLEAGDLFLTDARAFLWQALATKEEAGGKPDPRFEALDKDAQRFRSATPLSLVWSPTGAKDSFGRTDVPVHLTDEPYVLRFFRLLGPADPDVGGHPMTWVEIDPEGALKPDPQKSRRERALGEAGGFDCRLEPVGEIGKRKLKVPQVKHSARGYFRGQSTAVTTSVTVHDEADTLVVSAQRPPRGRIAIQANRKLYDRYAATKSAVSIVLDCSGSMARPKESPRWDAAMKAFETLLDERAGLPEGLTLSVSVFSAEEHGGRSERVWPSKEKYQALKNSDRSKIVTAVRKLTPSYRTPLLKSIKEGLSGLPENFDGRKILLVVTDGGDSYFYRKEEPKGYPWKKPYNNITTYLEETFSDKNKDVDLHVIGFDVEFNEEEHETQAAKELPKAVNSLARGRYTPAQNAKQLTDVLKGTLLNMQFLVDSAAGDEGYTRPPATASIGLGDDDERKGLHWAESLPAGFNTVRVPSIGREQPVRINAGDSLMLELSEKGFRRSVYARSPLILTDHHKEIRTAEPKDGWLASVLQNELAETGPRTLRLMTTIERDLEEADKARAAQVVRPRWTWFEVADPNVKSKKNAALRVFSLSGYPAPAWGLQVPDWPRQEAQAPALRAWWSEVDVGELHRDRVALPMRTPEGEKFRDYREKAWAGDDDGAILQSVRWVESVPIPQENGSVVVATNCLIVHLRYPPRSDDPDKDKGPFFVQPGTTASWDPIRGGQIHRFYQDAGKYTGIFWPFSEAEADKLREMYLISVPRLKKHSHTLRVEPDGLKGPNGEKGLGLPHRGQIRPKVP